MVDYAGAAVGTAFGELFMLVKHLVETVAAFRGQLKKIQTTLGHIEPIIKIIDKYNDRLNRGPEEMAPIKDLLEKGKALVDKCSRIQALSVRAKYAHSKKLTAFNAALVEKFQLYMLLLNARDEKEMLVDVKEIRGDVKEVKDMLTTVIWRSGAFQSGPEASGHPAVPAAPDFIVGSEVVESSRKLNKVGILEAASEGEIVREMITAGSQQFDFGTIRAATDNFSKYKRIGEGGFGAVYKGRLSNGQEIAVKRRSQNAGQGEVEFKSEVMLLARLQHRNLARLLGFCLEGVERLLIYEFVPNLSLDQFIFDPLKRASLDWDRRHKIIMGVARGLLYLHEDSRLRIIHRDLKASNILLGSDMNPKISDFGLARRLLLDQTQAETNRIVGTYGYMAPEYLMHGNFSVKSDVYSFGVLVLEIVSGQRTKNPMGNDMDDLISYVWKNWRERSIANIIDPSTTSGSSFEIARYIHIGLLCVQENAACRPTMASVLLMLNSHSVTLQVPSIPTFFIHSAIEYDMSSTDSSRVSNVKRSRGKSNHISINDASVTQYYNSRVFDDERLRGKSDQLLKNEASIMQDYSSRECEVERSRSKSNQFLKNEASMTDPHASFRKWDASIPCALLFMFLMVFGSTILQKKLSFCV